jgi:hypothetical protein
MISCSAARSDHAGRQEPIMAAAQGKTSHPAEPLVLHDGNRAGCSLQRHPAAVPIRIRNEAAAGGKIGRITDDHETVLGPQEILRLQFQERSADMGA